MLRWHLSACSACGCLRPYGLLIYHVWSWILDVIKVNFFFFNPPSEGDVSPGAHGMNVNYSTNPCVPPVFYRHTRTTHIHKHVGTNSHWQEVEGFQVTVCRSLTFSLHSARQARITRKSWQFWDPLVLEFGVVSWMSSRTQLSFTSIE